MNPFFDFARRTKFRKVRGSLYRLGLMLVMGAMAGWFGHAQAQSTDGRIDLVVCTTDADTGAFLEGSTVRVRRRPRTAGQPEAESITGSDGCTQMIVAVNVGTEDDPTVPDAFSTSAPYPNPVTDRALVPFVVDDAQAVGFAVYDVLGRRVTPEWREMISPGPYAMEVDVSGLADGVYLYRFEGAQGVSTGRMVKVGGGSGASASVRLTSRPATARASTARTAKSAEVFPVRVWANHESYQQVIQDVDVEPGATVVVALPRVGGSGGDDVVDNVPLIDMGETKYLGLYNGGLYGVGEVAMPPEHDAEGIARGQSIEPLDVDGNPDPNGHYILMSIGFSNASQEWCHKSDELVECNPWSFVGQALADPDVEKEHLVLVNGAKGGQTAPRWLGEEGTVNYDRIRDVHLTPLGLSEKQVAAIWLKVTNSNPTVSLPDPDAEAYLLKEQYADIVRTLKERYPNLKMVFFSSRIYGGYGNEEGVTLHPEPFAYESGFGVRWVIEAQINQMAGEGIDPDTGDLDYNTVAPWIAWGPYTWADGVNPRSDGLIWERSDFEDDGTHPSDSAEEKVGGMLLDYFKSSPQTKCWFLTDGQCSETVTSSQAIPLTEMTEADTYQGFQGGLYPDVSNVAPDAHAEEGLARANAIEPLDVDGNPDPNGKYVFMSIGMSNTTQEFCAPSTEPECNPWSFMGKAAADPEVNHSTLAIVNGAQGGKGADSWISASGDQYDRILKEELTPQGLSEKQVQVIYYKNANKASGSRPTLPDPEADAYLYLENLGLTARALKERYPNLKILFVSSRVYGGYAPLTTNNPEPWAYETGYSVKWLVEAQINQMNGGGIDPIAGDLDYNTVAPWIVWGPYFWADGLTPRNDGLLDGLYDGLFWERDDFEADGSHPAPGLGEEMVPGKGEDKISDIMMGFFKRTPYAPCWFVEGGVCER